jgi:HEAT repeats
MKRGTLVSRRAALAIVACAVTLGRANAQSAQPRLQNAKVENRAVSGPLDAAFRGIVNAQTSPAWIAYAVPQIPGDHTSCCFYTNNGVSWQGCSLEPNQGNVAFGPSGGTVRLEGPAEFFVFVRVEDKKVGKIRNYSIDCNIDAGGLPVYWLTGVNAAQSVALLESFAAGNAAASGTDERRIANGAISAIGLHRDAAANAALDRLTAAAQPEEIRRQAVVWMGNSRGRHGVESLLRILRDDPSDRVRESAIQALAQSKEPEAIPTVVKVAHDDKSARIRGQALFWLAQTASRQIVEPAIRSAIEQDPETQVKRKAVQSLMQMKNGEGVPLLMEIAKTNKNPVVRKEAMSQLGNSKDPRAVKFFEDLLTAR